MLGIKKERRKTRGRKKSSRKCSDVCTGDHDRKKTHIGVASVQGVERERERERERGGGEREIGRGKGLENLLKRGSSRFF